MIVNLKDLNSTVRSDLGLTALFLGATREVVYPAKWAAAPAGMQDGRSCFCTGRFRSVGVTGLSHKLEDDYHTRRDPWYILSGYEIM